MQVPLHVGHLSGQTQLTSQTQFFVFGIIGAQVPTPSPSRGYCTQLAANGMRTADQKIQDSYRYSNSRLKLNPWPPANVLGGYQAGNYSPALLYRTVEIRTLYGTARSVANEKYIPVSSVLGKTPVVKIG